MRRPLSDDLPQSTEFSCRVHTAFMGEALQ